MLGVFVMNRDGFQAENPSAWEGGAVADKIVSQESGGIIMAISILASLIAAAITYYSLPKPYESEEDE